MAKIILCLLLMTSLVGQEAGPANPPISGFFDNGIALLEKGDLKSFSSQCLTGQDAKQLLFLANDPAYEEMCKTVTQAELVLFKACKVTPGALSDDTASKDKLYSIKFEKPVSKFSEVTFRLSNGTWRLDSGKIDQAESGGK